MITNRRILDETMEEFTRDLLNTSINLLSRNPVDAGHTDSRRARRPEVVPPAEESAASARAAGIQQRRRGTNIATNSEERGATNITSRRKHLKSKGSMGATRGRPYGKFCKKTRPSIQENKTLPFTVARKV
ncbi:hypothetical protein PoB_001619600 [Plakobranchus ocellatus]|uniref:Uncharacterized protein n=1 Tax=Plakobranchus ocellatus TaxID=259542 RepID=A0AAV3YRC7_9GAST|nr:hypothetical protein PoB_001619600 [Plakobranchus ocellatus]